MTKYEVKTRGFSSVNVPQVVILKGQPYVATVEAVKNEMGQVTGTLTILTPMEVVNEPAD